MLKDIMVNALLTIKTSIEEYASIVTNLIISYSLK
jgi:hypothetical protein